jgi:hypothetical protein
MMMDDARCQMLILAQESSRSRSHWTVLYITNIAASLFSIGCAKENGILIVHTR